jgi:hypothetical protein
MESAEVYRHAERLILERGVGGTDVVWDLACGHGLVGLLLAYRFPDLRVVGIDRERRPAYAAYVQAWRTTSAEPSEVEAAEEAMVDAAVEVVEEADVAAAVGVEEKAEEVAADAAEKGLARVLGNIQLEVGDFNEVVARAGGSEVEGGEVEGGEVEGGEVEEDAESREGEECSQPLAQMSERSLVLCVHGCKEANQEAVVLARRAGAAWLVVPCCRQVQLYLKPQSLRLPDDTRYAFLCGAMAATYGAKRVSSVDTRLTARSIVLSGEADGF